MSEMDVLHEEEDFVEDETEIEESDLDDGEPDEEADDTATADDDGGDDSDEAEPEAEEAAESKTQELPSETELLKAQVAHERASAQRWRRLHDGVSGKVSGKISQRDDAIRQLTEELEDLKADLETQDADPGTRQTTRQMRKIERRIESLGGSRETPETAGAPSIDIAGLFNEVAEGFMSRHPYADLVVNEIRAYTEANKSQIIQAIETGDRDRVVAVAEDLLMDGMNMAISERREQSETRSEKTEKKLRAAKKNIAPVTSGGKKRGAPTPAEPRKMTDEQLLRQMKKTGRKGSWERIAP